MTANWPVAKWAELLVVLFATPRRGDEFMQSVSLKYPKQAK
jgi:hypothetical protein